MVARLISVVASKVNFDPIAQFVDSNISCTIELPMDKRQSVCELTMHTHILDCFFTLCACTLQLFY